MMEQQQQPRQRKLEEQKIEAGAREEKEKGRGKEGDPQTRIDPPELLRPLRLLDLPAAMRGMKEGGGDDNHEDGMVKLPAEPPVWMPRLIYGTAWKGDRTEELVYHALRAGFRAFDTAAQPQHYDEAAVGRAVRRAVQEGVVRREDLFVRAHPKTRRPVAYDYAVVTSSCAYIPCPYGRCSFIMFFLAHRAPPARSLLKT